MARNIIRRVVSRLRRIALHYRIPSPGLGPALGGSSSAKVLSRSTRYGCLPVRSHGSKPKDADPGTAPGPRYKLQTFARSPARIPYYGIPAYGIMKPSGDPEFRQPEGRPILSRGPASQDSGLGRRRPGRRAEARHARLCASASRSGRAARQPIGGVEGRPRGFPQHPHQRPMADHLSLERLRSRRCGHPRPPLSNHHGTDETAKTTYGTGGDSS